MRKRPLIAVFVLVALMSALFAAPSTALAATSPTIHVITKAETIAYNRCVKAAKAYASNPDVITVSIADLGLTKEQAEDVELRIHSNGELWWINTFAITTTTKQISMPCKYSDATTAAMQKKFEAVVATAMKRVSPGMKNSTKIHMLHDWLIRKVGYQDRCKNAYDALVSKKADCFGFTLATDVLMRRAGYATDVAYNDDPNVDHSWNLVKLSGKWYHVDTTWDRWYTYEVYEGKLRHKYLLQSDKVMNQDTHKGWVAHYRCTSDKFEEDAYLDGAFEKQCNSWKTAVRAFNSGGLRYTVTGYKKASVARVNASKQSASSLTVPATVTYKKVTYAVTGIKAKTFAKAKAKTVYIKTTKLSKARVANSLAGSKVKYVKVPKKYLKAYKSYFAKANSGKAVTVSSSTTKVLKAA